MELVFFYENKSQPQELKHMVLKDRMIKLHHIDGNPLFPVYSITINPEDMENVIVPVLSLAQNHPNPFNPSTTISFYLPQAMPCRVEIFNIRGQKVKTLLSGTMLAGKHSLVWNGEDDSGRAVSSGVYCYRLITPQSTQTGKMLMVK